MQKRKYRKGKKLTSVAEMIGVDFIYMCDKIQNKGWFRNWSLVLCEQYVKKGYLYEAVRNKEKENGERNKTNILK